MDDDDAADGEELEVCRFHVFLCISVVAADSK